MVVGALDGLRVIDFGQYIAGPLTGMFLADQGADVIKVDPPGGPRWDTPANATWNRGKRSIVLDLSREEDRVTARRLVHRADVVIENFRPGVMSRLGLDPEQAIEANPRLIFCSIPGFASDDPRAGIAAWEGVVAAATDTYRTPGADQSPRFTAVPIASTFAALIAATSIGAALFSRERDGRGQRLEIPLFDAMFSAIGANGLSVAGADSSGGRPNDFGGGVFQCSDGRWALISLAKPHFLERFALAAGLADRIDIPRLKSDRATRDMLSSLLPELMRSRTADEWEQLGAAADLPLVRVRTAREWMETDHARQSSTIIPIEDPRLGRTWQPNSPIRLGRSDASARRPARPLDADRAAVLVEASEPISRPQPDERPARHAALDGVKVIDLSQVLAGPTGTRTLGELGAHVVKINPLEEPGAGIQFSVHRYHTDVNRAKQSMLLDLKHPDGLDVFWRLLESADVVLHNFRPGVLERLGIDYETARRRQPGIIYTSITAFGQGGAWGQRPGYEPFGQAPTGLMDRQGGDGQPAMQPFAVNDYGTGLSSAMATVFALYEREKTGFGQQGEASLAFTGSILQTPFLIDFEGKEWDEPRGSEVRGFTPLQRLYRATDGWFFVGAGADQLAVLAKVAGLSNADASQPAELAAALERCFAEHTVDQWCTLLVSAGIGAHRLVQIADLMRDPWVIAHGLSVTRPHDTGETITTVGPPARFSRTPVHVGVPAASPGADGPAVLRDIGFSPEDVQLIVAGGALRLHLAGQDGAG